MENAIRTDLFFTFQTIFACVQTFRFVLGTLIVLTSILPLEKFLEVLVAWLPKSLIFSFAEKDGLYLCYALRKGR